MRTPIFVLLPSECLGGKIEKHTKNSKWCLILRAYRRYLLKNAKKLKNEQ